MKELVETFYDLSVLDTEQMIPQREKFNLSNLLINLIAENALALESKNIQPDIKLPEYSVFLNSDRSMVERMIQNLLTNAVRYSSGTIKISLSQKEQEGAAFVIENSVKDSLGPDTKRLFERFYTGDKARTNGSTGLGLAVVKLLAEKLGGTVAATLHEDNLVVTLEI